MIALLRGWSRAVRGDVVVMQAQHKPLGELRYREVYGPLRPIRAIVDERLASTPLPTSIVEAISPALRLVTNEGEYAGLVRVDLTCDESIVSAGVNPTPGQPPGRRPACRMFGVTFGDNFTTLIDGLSLEPQHFAEFEQVVRNLTVGSVMLLGHRRRRFFYRRPPGWQALATQYTTRYIPPGYPNDAAMITVMAALPAGGSHWFLESVLNELRERNAVVGQVAAPERFMMGTLDIHRWRLTSQLGTEVRAHEAVLLQDYDYVYRVRLDRAPDNQAALTAFETLCGSIEPLPSGVITPNTEDASPFAHWSL